MTMMTKAAAATAAAVASLPSGGGGRSNRSRSRSLFIFHWFRHDDLRLADNPALMESVARSGMLQQQHKHLQQQQQQQRQAQEDSDSAYTTSNSCLVPLFVLDSRLFGNDAHTSGRPRNNYSYTQSDNNRNNKHLKTGVKRAKFLLESVHDVQCQLRHLASGLAVAHGEPGDVFDEILTRIQKDHGSAAENENNNDKNDNMAGRLVDVTIVCQEEVFQEELDAVEQVKTVLKKHHSSNDKNSCFGTLELRQVWGSTMYELSDILPLFESSSSAAGTSSGRQRGRLTDMPDTFTPFRNKVEQHCTIQRPLSSPKRHQLLPPLPTASGDRGDSGSGQAITRLLRDWMDAPLPTLQQLGYTEEQVKEAYAPTDKRGVLEFCGGERAALARVKDYIWTKNLLKDYFDTRNGMLGGNSNSTTTTIDYSTKLSPWLALGCISPRTIAMECRSYETRVIANKSTYWLVFELLVRDYCKFFAVKHGNAIFRPFGITDSITRQQTKNWSRNRANFDAWKIGQTGYPLVDANMREMKVTGFMSNRGRQNVCSFLAFDLNHDWRWGADWFESQLIDYDVYSNWYNWCAGAAMTGGRRNRFNIVKQSKDYDANGD
jgi:deoxyribodipyrimidine photo-lyase